MGRTLTTWEPFQDLDSFFRLRPRVDTWVPPVEIEESPTAVHLAVELPGLARNDIRVEVEDGTLTISGERRGTQKSTDKEGYRRSERYYGSFSRSFQLGESIDTEKAQAEMKDGVLHVDLPKTELAKPKQIEVKVH